MVAKSAAEVHQLADYDPSNRGPIKRRGCTDTICLVIFVTILLAWIAIGVYAFVFGSPPGKVLFPTDTEGRVCGQGVNQGRPYLLFFDITKCGTDSTWSYGCPTKQVCVKECPNSNLSPWFESNKDLSVIQETALKAKMKPFCDHTKYSDLISAKDLVDAFICPPWFAKSYVSIDRCVPDAGAYDDEYSIVFSNGQMSPSFSGAMTAKKLGEYVEVLESGIAFRREAEFIISDLQKSWPVLLVGAAVSAATAYLWIALMKLIGGCMVWTSIVLLIAAMLVCSGIFFTFFIVSLTNDDVVHGPWHWLVLFIVMLLAVIVLLIAIYLFRKKIQLAVVIIKEASVCIGYAPASMAFPFLPILLDVGILAWSIAVAVFLQSTSAPRYYVSVNTNGSCTVGDLKLEHQEMCDGFRAYDCEEASSRATCQFAGYWPSPWVILLHAYNIFAFVWAVCFTSGFSEMVLAGVFVAYYWVLDKRRMPKMPVWTSLRRTLAYHLGTVSLGSLVISLVRVVRTLFELFAQDVMSNEDPNLVAGCCAVCGRWCVSCFEDIVRAINQNAYIITTIYGKHFFWSAKKALGLLLKNILRVVAVRQVASLVFIVCELFTVCLIVLICVLVFHLFGNFLMLTHGFIAVVAVGITSFFVVNKFFSVFSMAVDTLFLCFVLDLELNHGTLMKPYFSTKDLYKVLHNDD